MQEHRSLGPSPDTTLPPLINHETVWQELLTRWAVIMLREPPQPPSRLKSVAEMKWLDCESTVIISLKLVFWYVSEKE